MSTAFAGVLIESLRLESLRQLTVAALAPLVLGSLVLEPNLDLVGADAQLRGE